MRSTSTAGTSARTRRCARPGRLRRKRDCSLVKWGRDDSVLVTCTVKPSTGDFRATGNHLSNRRLGGQIFCFIHWHREDIETTSNGSAHRSRGYWRLPDTGHRERLQGLSVDAEGKR